MTTGLWSIPNGFTPGTPAMASILLPLIQNFRPHWGACLKMQEFILKLLPSLDVAEGTSSILPGTAREKSIASMATDVPNYGSSAIRADHNDFPFPSGQWA